MLTVHMCSIITKGTTNDHVLGKQIFVPLILMCSPLHFTKPFSLIMLQNYRVTKLHMQFH